jgi:hypothetical protein
MGHHFFASTCMNWAVGATRAEAIARVAKDVGSVTLKRYTAKKGDGLFVWSCRVEADITAEYRINFYQPQGIEISAQAEHNIQNTKGHVLPTD